MAPDQPFFDSGEPRLISFDIEVNGLELADLFTLTIDQVLAVPLAEVAVFDDPIGIRLGLVDLRRVL